MESGIKNKNGKLIFSIIDSIWGRADFAKQPVQPTNQGNIIQISVFFNTPCERIQSQRLLIRDEKTRGVSARLTVIKCDGEENQQR